MNRLSARETLAYGCCLAVVLGLGVLNLNFPFVADHVMALLGAKALLAGGTLYVDFWDNKMPGLFWFYVLADRLFGLDEFGVHATELLWMTTFSVVLIAALRDYCFQRWMSGLVAITVVGVFYAAAEPFQLVQIEILTGLPLFLCAWFATRLEWAGRRALTACWASGVMAGVVVTFKLILAPLCVAFWLVAAVHQWQTGRADRLRMLLGGAAAMLAGLCLVLGAVAFTFWRDGNLAELYWTAFVYPRVALLAAPPAGYFRLAESSLFFVSVYAAWALFIVIAVADWWTRERHVLTSVMLAWLLTAAGVILIQRFSWWSYHFLLLFTPAGILAVRGLGVLPRLLAARAGLSRRHAAALALAFAYPAVAGLAVPGEQKLSAHIDTFVRMHEDSGALHRLLNRKYALIEHSVRFLSTGTARPGPVYVFGDPLYYHLSGRSPALPVPGWAWQYFLQSQWEQLPEQLRRAMPAYIYIDSESVKIMAVREAGVLDYIQSAYAPFTTDHDGTWYQIRPDLWRERHPAEAGSATPPG